MYLADLITFKRVLLNYLFVKNLDFSSNVTILLTQCYHNKSFLLRNLYISALLLILPLQSMWAQESKLVWQRTIGGEGNDIVNEMTTDDQGNIYVLSTIQSNGNHDALLSCVNSDGQQLWVTQIGGNKDDKGVSLSLNEDEIVALISSNSTEGLTSQSMGYTDVLVVRFDLSGNLIKESRFGGSFVDSPADLTVLPNGNFLVSASSRSTNGNVTHNNGQYDVWVFETTVDGDIIWENSMGGTDEDIAMKNVVLNDGTYLIAGHSTSSEGAFSDNMGDLDIVLFQVDKNGSELWHKSYGGFYSETVSDMILLPTGNIVVAGSTFSPTIGENNNAGGSDAWIFEVEPNGTMVWDKTYGYLGNESVSSIQSTSEGFFILGTTSSDYLNENTNHGEQDIWLCELNNDKEIVHQTLLGASGFDAGQAMLVQNDRSILIGGSTNSIDGQIQGNQGNTDGWLLKVQHQQTGFLKEAHIHPNPTRNVIYINKLGSNSKISIHNLQGQLIYQENCSESFANIVDLSNQPSGVYQLRIESDRGIESHRIVKH
jgi:hypothetical protein